MDFLLTPATELEAVNGMLSVIGESPVNTLEDSGHVDAITALRILRTTSREVQSQVWHWNTEKGYRLTPTVPEGHLSLPANTLRVDTVGASKTLDVVQRGTRLWDRRRHTYQFDHAVTVDLTLALAYEELPEAARHYIAIRAGRIFQERVLGSDTLSSFAERDELQARRVLEEAEAETSDFNLLGSWAVARILQR